MFRNQIVSSSSPYLITKTICSSPDKRNSNISLADSDPSGPISLMISNLTANNRNRIISRQRTKSNPSTRAPSPEPSKTYKIDVGVKYDLIYRQKAVQPRTKTKTKTKTRKCTENTVDP